MQPLADISSTLHRGLEQCDIDAMLSLYADGAQVEIMDHNHSPSRSIHLKGKPELERYFREVLTRPVTHHIDDEVISGDHLAYTENCVYPDGSRVFTSAMAVIRDGKIVREVDVQEWDENP